MMILEILKWIGIGVIVLFGLGCVLAFVLMIAFVLVADEQEKQMQGELPFHCMITDTRCPTPELPCNQCEEYKREIGESEYDNQNNGNTQDDRGRTERID